MPGGRATYSSVTDPDLLIPHIPVQGFLQQLRPGLGLIQVPADGRTPTDSQYPVCILRGKLVSAQALRIRYKLRVAGYARHNLRGWLENRFIVRRPDVITFALYGTENN